MRSKAETILRFKAEERLIYVCNHLNRGYGIHTANMSIYSLRTITCRIAWSSLYKRNKERTVIVKVT